MEGLEIQDNSDLHPILFELLEKFQQLLLESTKLLLQCQHNHAIQFVKGAQPPNIRHY